MSDDSANPPAKSKRGGRRPGAGRPPGSARDGYLPGGAVRAIKALKRAREARGVPPEADTLGEEAINTVVEVMRGNAGRYCGFRLSAAAMVLDDVYGPVPKKSELTGKDGGPVAVSFSIDIEGGEK